MVNINDVRPASGFVFDMPAVEEVQANTEIYSSFPNTYINPVITVI